MKKGKKGVVGIKVGSNLITNGDGRVNAVFVFDLCRQIVRLQELSYSVFLVSSGAIAMTPNQKYSDALRASIGQPKIIALYQEIFNYFNVECAQFLLTDDDFKRKEITKVFSESFRFGVVPICNANDPTDSFEIQARRKCADNDVLFGKICLRSGLKVDYAILAFMEKGFLDKNKKVINIIQKDKRERYREYAVGGSCLGHGNCGALAKFDVACKLADAGIATILAPGREDDFVLRAIRELNGVVKENFGTIFL